jgi:ubiquinone/menaquinone biosynthesis C-methylase UbiE
MLHVCRPGLRGSPTRSIGGSGSESGCDDDGASQLKLRPRLVRQEDRVSEHFDAVSSDWDDLYHGRSLRALVFQERSSFVLKWIDELSLPQGSRLLDIGCGPGWVSIAFAERGFCVSSVDSAHAMIETTRRNVSASAKDELVNVSVGDAHRLAFDDETFSVVMALGLLSYLDSPEQAIREMARVTRPGGYVVLTSANPFSLPDFFDPRRNALLQPVRIRVRDQLTATGLWQLKGPLVTAKRYSAARVDRLLEGAGFRKIRGGAFGFGPFTVWHRHLISEERAKRLHSRLQALADRNTVVIRNAGRWYIVLAQKA